LHKNKYRFILPLIISKPYDKLRISYCKLCCTFCNWLDWFIHRSSVRHCNSLV